jgi:uncharacterized membrane protein YkgB
MDVLFSRSQTVGDFMLRYALGVFFVLLGLYKFTAEEAAAIEPLVANSPFLSWLYLIFSVQVTSALIGVVEIVIGGLILARRFFPMLSAFGNLGAAASLFVTLSFLFTTPGLNADASDFLIKDIFLLGIALWSAGLAWTEQVAQVAGASTSKAEA